MRPAAPRVRTAPDDSDLAAVIPRGADTLLEIDMAVLRISPWSRPAIEAAPPDERRAKAAARGFDEIADVDRLAFAQLAGRADEAALVVAQGRFRRDEVVAAFQRGASGAPAESWRGCHVFVDGDRAIAFLTPRTLLSGPPAAVRAAIDTAWGVLDDVRADGELGEVRRSTGDRGRAPTARLSMIVTDEVRRRAAAALSDDARLGGLRRVGARLDLGADLEIGLCAMLDTPAAAGDLAAVVSTALRQARSRPLMVVLGLGPILEGARVAAQGARVFGSLRIAEARRDDLAARLAAVRRQLAAGMGAP